MFYLKGVKIYIFSNKMKCSFSGEGGDILFVQN